MASLKLSELRERVTNRVAMISFGPAKRHKPEVLDAWINEALQQYELLLTESGHPQRIARTTLTTSAITTQDANGWPANEFVELPDDFFELHRLSFVDGDTRRTLDQYAETETQDLFGADWWQSDGQLITGQPLKYRLGRYRDEDGVTHAIARLLPATNAAYTLELVYQPVPPELAADDDAYDFFPGTSDFVVCAAAMSVHEYDGIQEPSAYKALRDRRDECAAIVQRRAPSQARGGTRAMSTAPQRDNRFARRR